jgi:hypothetical protein
MESLQLLRNYFNCMIRRNCLILSWTAPATIVSNRIAQIREVNRFGRKLCWEIPWNNAILTTIDCPNRRYGIVAVRYSETALAKDMDNGQIIHFVLHKSPSCFQRLWHWAEHNSDPSHDHGHTK